LRLLPRALRLPEDRTLLRLRLLSSLLRTSRLLPLRLLRAFWLLLLLLNPLLRLLPRLLCTLLLLLRLLSTLLLLATSVLPTVLIALLVVLRVDRSHRSKTQERGHAGYSYMFHRIHRYCFLSSVYVEGQLNNGTPPHFSPQHAKQVGD
jgi:hypothetical protein